MMFGAHLSIAGGLVNALVEAERLGMDCAQIFTKSQRQWRVPPLDRDARDEWLAKLAAMGWDRPRGPARVVAHNSYLINLASPSRALWKRSVAAQRDEIERCEALHVPLLVAHPGAHLGTAPPRSQPLALDGPPSAEERAGLDRIVRALDRLHDDLPGYRTITCLETTTGAGTTLGHSFHHLAHIRARVKAPERVAFCLDTCHIVAAGYDMSTDERAASVLRHFDRTCGRGTVRVVHVNDSAGALGSRLDRHAHIGHGRCGIACFRTIVNRPSLARVAKILETPKEEKRPGLPWDVVNLRRLKRLIRRPHRSR
jgi:deoxyribonuclease-4